MPLISDLEIIKSAIIYGDLDDAMSVIRKRQESLSYYLKRNPKEKQVTYSKFLKSLESLLKGEINLDTFRNEVGALDSLPELLDMTGDTGEILESLYYLLEYSLDRYDVRYPAYDGKRCDDK
ncbi:MAG: hypothetical protein M1129_00845 [Candidatus Thermoplasmatota archaeon]|jgi:hypothetical protein|nr:hypothetical protein [Candidatus Thermoplasmatota archaeon]MCL5954968.1 hypothetical protein [Candidatus Thermoplasmatota archaeon]